MNQSLPTAATADLLSLHLPTLPTDAQVIAIELHRAALARETMPSVAQWPTDWTGGASGEQSPRKRLAPLPDATAVSPIAGRFRPDDAIPFRSRTSATDTAANVGSDSVAFHRTNGKAWTARNAAGYRTATIDEVLAMPSPLFSALWTVAHRRAMRMAMIAGTNKGDGSTNEAPADRDRTSSTPHLQDVRDETEDVATEAVFELFGMAAKGKAERPFGLVATIAGRMAMRRSQHRIRMRSGLVDAPTDRKVPKLDAGRTLHELASALPPSRRAAWLNVVDGTLAGSIRRDNGVRTLRTMAAPLSFDSVTAAIGDDDNPTVEARIWLDDRGHMSAACCSPIATPIAMANMQHLSQ